jgi:hypothetical protein
MTGIYGTSKSGFLRACVYWLSEGPIRRGFWNTARFCFKTPATRRPDQTLTLGLHAVASGIIVLSAPGMRLRELGAVDRCISEPSKRGRNIAKDPQWSLGKYFGIELLSLLVEFLGRRDYGDPAHQLVDFVAANTGSDRDKVVLTQLKTTARSHMKNLAK